MIDGFIAGKLHRGILCVNQSLFLTISFLIIVFFRMFLLDAIPHCGTSGCAKVINHAIKQELVNGERGNMFLSGLALVNSPSEEMIGHVLNLCEARPSRTGMLTLGTLIHKMCEDGHCDDLVG